MRFEGKMREKQNLIDEIEIDMWTKSAKMREC